MDYRCRFGSFDISSTVSRSSNLGGEGRPKLLLGHWDPSIHTHCRKVFTYNCVGIHTLVYVFPYTRLFWPRPHL